MAKLYRKKILKEQEQPGLVALGELTAAAPAEPRLEVKEDELVAGDYCSDSYESQNPPSGRPLLWSRRL